MKTMKPQDNQRGATAIIVALLLVVLLGAGAFVTDFGFAWVASNELHNAADAGALAGTRALGKFYCPETDPAKPCKSKADQDDTTIAEVESAIRDSVKDVVGLNSAAGASLSIDNGDIRIGTWDSGTGTFAVNAVPPTAVQVRTRRDDTTNGPMQTFLGIIFGVSSINLSKPATAALSGLSEVEEGEIDIPLGVSDLRDCSNPEVKLDPTAESCAGWTSFFDPKGTAVKPMQETIDGMRTDTVKAPAVDIGDTLYFDGGEKNPLFNALYNLYMAKRDPVTREWTALVPVYHDSPVGGHCMNPNTGLKIVGFATIKFKDVDPTTNADDPIGCIASVPSEPIKTCPLAKNYLRGELTCNVEPGRGGGGGSWAVGSIPGLVQ